MNILTKADRVTLGSPQRVIDQGEPVIRRGRRQSVPAEALLLRGWALHLLGTVAGPPETIWQAAARASPASWEFFLRMERCTLALKSWLDIRGDWQHLPAEVVALIRAHATNELRRVLSARAQIKTVGRLAASKGWTVMVLKGGVAAAAGELIDLGDVDILVDRERVHEMAAALGELGFERDGADLPGIQHLAARVMPNALHIEVHRSLKRGADLEALRPAALPLDGEPALWRQGPVDHLRYLLHHSTIQHPERIGRIRDLLLIGHALRHSTPTEIAEVEAGFAGQRDGALTLSVLRTARELEDDAFSGDTLAPVALRVYTLFHRFGRFGRDRRGAEILLCTARLVCFGRRFWWDGFRYLRAAPMSTISALPGVAWLQRHLPSMADLVRNSLRILTFGAGTVLALVVAGEARLAERRAVGAEDF